MVGVLWLTLAASGCPLREKEIRISELGASWVIKACMPSTSPGGGGPGGGGPSGPSGPGNGGPPGGGWPTGGTGGGGSGGGGSGGGGSGGGGSGGGGGGYTSCIVDGHYPTYPNLYSRPTDARLFLISPGDKRIQAASKCMSLHPCHDGGRYGGTGTTDCMASDLNQQLDGAMPNGLGFDGLKNPDEAQLVLAFYQPLDTSEENGGCHRADMVACAGLAAPLAGGAYDISCASCQGGQKTTTGNDTGPCPRQLANSNSCFLQYCDEVLGQNGYD